ISPFCNRVEVCVSKLLTRAGLASLSGKAAPSARGFPMKAAVHGATKTRRTKKNLISDPDHQPETLPIEFAGIPVQLREPAQWVNWRWGWREDNQGRGEWTKIPINPRTGGKASSTNPDTWGTVELAMANYTLRGQDWHIFKALELMDKQGGGFLLRVSCHLVEAVVDGRLELLEGIKPGGVQGLLANESPQAFDEVEVWRVGGQEQQADSQFLRQRLHQHAALIRGIVQHHRNGHP